MRKLGSALILTVALTACGKKGPPLPPLNLVPDRPVPTTARVVDGTDYIQSTIPTRNANGPGAVNVGHVDAVAVTVAAGAYPPPDPQFFKLAHPVGRVNVRPPPDPNAEVDETAPPDDRPGPGATIAFAEKLTPANMEPEITTDKPAAAERPPYVLEVPAADVLSSPDAVPAGGASVASSGGAGLPAGPPNGIDAAFLSELPPLGTLTMPGTPAGPATAAPRQPALRVTSRIYAVRGFSRKGRPGTASPRLAIPLVPPPPAPASPAVTFSETAITVTWTAPELPASAAPLKYNVYVADGSTPPKPLNPAPLAALTFESQGIEMDVERCFVVRSVRQEGDVALESAASPSACVTPHDIFPPAAPKALAAVAGAGAINLIWDANTEADLAGYLVLRGDPAGGTLQPLTSQPIRETRYADTTAQPGVQYVYAVVAVDKKGNRSDPSNKVTETGR